MEGISIKNVTKTYSQRILFSKKTFNAVENVSLDITTDPPEIFSLVGESGSGKSTLANS
jgi:peptide/nickel transport system ATP-binding protein